MCHGYTYYCTSKQVATSFEPPFAADEPWGNKGFVDHNLERYDVESEYGRVGNPA